MPQIAQVNHLEKMTFACVHGQLSCWLQIMLRTQWDGSRVNPSMYEHYCLAPESPQSPGDSKGHNSFEDEGRVGQE